METAINGYGAVAALRAAIIDEIKAELPEGVPFTVEHYLLAEHRLQTALMVALGNIQSEVESVVEGKKAQKKD